MTLAPTSEPVPDLPPDGLPPADDLPSDPPAPSFGAPAADHIAADDAAAPIGAPNPAQDAPAFAPPPPPDATDPGLPLSPADAARDNARDGHWAMSEWYDGWVYLGADGRPVTRNDGSRIGFRFADAARLTQALAAAPEETADGSNRRALAPLDSRFNKDWDPQRPKSTLADMTKWTRLLAYHLVQTTEPEEAVRRAVSMIFGNPVTMDDRGEKLWVPTQYDAETVKSLADTLLRQAVGAGPAKGDDQALGAGDTSSSTSDPLPTTGTVRGVPIDGRGLSRSLTRTAATSNNSTTIAGNQKVGTASNNLPMAPPGVDLDANIAEAWKRRGDATWFRAQVKNKGPWDYKQQGKDKYQDFGNFHYGATGAAMGFSEATLLRMAGWAQTQSGNQGSGTSPGQLLSFLGVGGEAPYRDDPVDQYWVSRGYQYYHQNKRRWELPPPPSKLRGRRKP